MTAPTCLACRRDRTGEATRGENCPSHTAGTVKESTDA